MSRAIPEGFGYFTVLDGGGNPQAYNVTAQECRALGVPLEPCDACGAEHGEPCDPFCLGVAAQQDKAQS